MAATRLRPRGPFVQWAAASPDTGITAARGDWAAGRSLVQEEKECGILATLRHLVDRSQSGVQRYARAVNANPKNLALSAVFRAQPSDFQMNEVNALGKVASLRKAPKGKWRKVSKQKTVMVEDDGNVPFSDPDKTYTPRVQSLGEYVRELGKIPEHKPVLPFLVYRDSRSLANVENRLLYEAGIQNDAVGLFEQSAGYSSCITQHGVAVGVSKEALPHASRHYGIHPLLFEPQAYASLDDIGSLTAAPRGAFYRVLLRCVGAGDYPRDIEESVLASACTSLNTTGFINYFGISSFGVGSNRQHELVAAASAGDYSGAVTGFLQCEAEKSAVHFKYLSRYFNAVPSTASAIALDWADVATQMRVAAPLRNILNELAQCRDFSPSSKEMEHMWSLVPHKERLHRSAARFVWNAVASQRMISHGLRVVPGDVVRVRAQSASPSLAGKPAIGGGILGEHDARIEWEYRRVTEKEASSGAFSIHDVVLPVPYVRNAAPVYPDVERSIVKKELYEQFAAKHNLSFLFDEGLRESAQLPDNPFVEAREALYRPLLARPEGMEASMLEDPNSTTAIKTDVFLLEERQPIQQFHMDYDRRIREPSIFNVSERFTEKMQPMKAAHRGRRSVALTFFLPHESDASVMLRDAFDIFYGTSHDLFSFH